MIPASVDDLSQSFVVARQPDLTYYIDFERGRVVGTSEGLEAVKQAVHLILHTDRYAYEIYTPNYGNELSTLFGTSPPLVYAQIQQAVEEALSVDDRITGASDFSFTKKRGAIFAQFTVNTIYGAIDEELEVVV